MSLRGQTLVAGETHHVFNRGAHKREIFYSKEDYFRFQMLLFVLNTKDPIVMRDLLAKYKGRSFVEIFREEKPDQSLVDILAYTLMPNHFHFVLRQKTDTGISVFMKKLCTAYSMYFNTKYEHSGVLLQGRYKNSHIDNEPYFRYIFSYVHLNHLELVQPDWKEKGIKNKNKVQSFFSTYSYSSYHDYCVTERPESAILAKDDVPEFLKNSDLEDLFKWESSSLFTKDRPM